MKYLVNLILILCFLHFCHRTYGQQGQIHVEHAPSDGIYVQNPGKDGIMIDTAEIGLHVLQSVLGVAVEETVKNGISIVHAGKDGLFLYHSGSDGINIDSAYDNGISISRTGKHGVHLSEVDSNAIQILHARRGIEIRDVNEGIRMRNIGGNGATIENPFLHGIDINGAGVHGVVVRNTEGNGVDVSGSGTHGIRIQESNTDGLQLRHSGSNGIDVFDSQGQGLSVSQSGSNGAAFNNSGNHGVKINGTVANGIQIGNTGSHGIQIDTAASDGILIDAPGDDGINIVSASNDGMTILNSGNDGIHVNSANRHAGIFVNSNGSTHSSVLISHADDTRHDLQLAGNGRMSSDQNFTFQLDGDNSIANATFMIRNSAGHAPFIVTEDGDLGITGHLSKGSGSFKIDHPLDPQNKYLYHSFVESPDMMNIYNGSVFLDENGNAKVTMPDWFDALNKEFRYQLTAIGHPAQLYVASEMEGRSFRIAGGKSGMKVSWQVTGIRQDKFANANRIQVEVDKEDEQKGTYTHPELWTKNVSANNAQILSKPTKQ